MNRKSIVMCTLMMSLPVAADSLHLVDPEYRSAAPSLKIDINSTEDIKKLSAGNKPVTQNKGIQITISGRAGNAINLFEFAPENINIKTESLPLIYFIHGGGYITGSTQDFAETLTELADKHRAKVVGVDYRLATEAPFPADVNDAYDGLVYLYHHAKDLHINPEKIIVMGESAGGGLAARMLLMLRDTKEVPVSGQILIYPMLDSRTGTPASPYNNPFAGEFVWTAKSNQFGWRMLLGSQNIPESQRGYFSPALAQDLKGLPPAFIVTGALDLFADEDITYAQRLIHAGVNTELHVLPGLFHAFEYINPNSHQAVKYKELRYSAISRMLDSAG